MNLDVRKFDTSKANFFLEKLSAEKVLINCHLKKGFINRNSTEVGLNKSFQEYDFDKIQIF